MASGVPAEREPGRHDEAPTHRAATPERAASDPQSSTRTLPALLGAGNQAVAGLFRRAAAGGPPPVTGGGNRAIVAMLRGASRDVQDAAGPAIPDGPGALLPDNHRAAFEQALDHPLGHVRVHDGPAEDSAARSLGADAFTVGSHVYFASRAYAPGTSEGDRKLGHELIHVVQHDRGRMPSAGPSARDPMVSSPSDALEVEAYLGETALAEKASAARATGLPAASPVTSPAAPPTSPALASTGDQATVATPGSLGPGPDDEQLLPAVPREAPQIVEGGGAPPAAPPTAAAPAAPPVPAPPAAPNPLVAPATVIAPATPMTDWVEAPAAAVPDQAGPATVLIPGSPGAGGADIAGYAAELDARQTAVGEAVTAEVTRLIEAARAAAAEERAGLTATYDQQIQTVSAATATGLAGLAAAAERERSAITTSADAARQRLTAAHDAARQEAIAHVDGLKAQALAAGEAEAARSIAGSDERATAILQEAQNAGAGGEPPSVEAQTKAARRIGERAADQCRQTGARVASIVRQEAAQHVAGNYDPMLRDFLAKIEESRPGTERAITGFAQTAMLRVDETATNAATALRALGEQATATLGRERAAALAEVDAWEAQAAAGITQAGARARVATAPVGAEFAQAASESMGDEEAGPEDVAALAAARDVVLTGLDGARSAVITALGESFAQLAGSLRQNTAERRSAAESTGAKVSAGATAGVAGATESMAALVASLREHLAAGAAEAEEKLAAGANEFRGGLRGVHDKALTAFTKAVDDGLASEDALIGKARSELAAVPRTVDAKYAGLKGESENKSRTFMGITVPAARVHRGIWSSITGWVSDLHERAKKWFADTFGEWLGGLLLGILEGLVLVAVGLLIGWAVGAVVGFFIAAAEVAAIVTLAIMVVAGVGLNIYNRFQEFYADNPGQDAGFWRGLGLVGLGIADLTGIPFVVEGLVGQRAFGAKMSKFDSAERLGMGLVFFGAALVSAKNILRAKPKVTDRPAARPEPEPHPSAAPPAGLSPKLQAIRAALKDPRAIEQFDNMFAGVKSDAPKLERIMDGFASKGSIEERLIKDWQAKNPTPEPPRGEDLAKVPQLKADAVALREELAAFRQAHPDTPGLADRIKALDAEIEGLDRMLDGRTEATPDQVTSKRSNIDGIRDEFRDAQQAAGLVGMSRKFALDGRLEAVEVDVVADGGKLWTDVKSTEPFGLESNAWTGKPGHQGLKVQAEEMVRSAQQNPHNGAAPKVRFKFTKGVTREVRTALEAMGIEVTGPTVEPNPIPVPVPGDRDKDKDGGR